MRPITWAILTGEFPPKIGGVSDYTRQVATSLSQSGDRVRVFARRFHFTEFDELTSEIDSLGPDARVLVQYVPHAFGWRAMNVPFCTWLHAHRDRWNIDVMFHEVAYPLSPTQPLRHNLLGHVNRMMAKLLARSARRIFVSTIAWRELLRPLIDPATPIRALPVPTNLPADISSCDVEAVRKEFAPRGEILIGHFGDRGKWIAPLLSEVLKKLADKSRKFMLIGRGKFDLSIDRLIQTGNISSRDAAAHISACDLLVQPYPDGITTRRSSTMAALALGRPVVSAVGEHTESIWQNSGAVALANCNNPHAIADLAEKLLADRHAREELSRRAKPFYDQHFALDHTIRALREME